MPTPIRPTKFAHAADFDPVDFREAVKNGEQDYAGIPIASWRQNGGEYLNVPDDYAEQLGFQTGRSNPSAGRDLPTKENGAVDLREMSERISNEEYGEGAFAGQKSVGQAAAEAAPPVTANAGAAYAAGKFADTVKEQPQVMEDFADTAALLGAAGLAYATTEEGNPAQAALATAGMFAVFKGLRYACNQGDRQTDMDERQQRHQIQQKTRGQMGNARQRRLPQNETGSAVQIGGA